MMGAIINCGLKQQLYSLVGIQKDSLLHEAMDILDIVRVLQVSVFMIVPTITKLMKRTMCSVEKASVVACPKQRALRRLATSSTSTRDRGLAPPTAAVASMHCTACYAGL